MKRPLAVAITTCPGLRYLDCEPPALSVRHGCPDDVSVHLVADYRSNEGRSAWRSAELAWTCLDAIGADHALVLQDDVIPCDGFIEAAIAVAELVPHAAVSFFVPYDTDRIGGLVPLRAERFQHAQAVMMPRAMAAAFLAHEPANAAWRKHDDLRMRSFFLANDVRVLGTVPSLVEHDVSVPSTLGHAPVQAGSFIGARSWRDLEWLSGAGA